MSSTLWLMQPLDAPVGPARAQILRRRARFAALISAITSLPYNQALRAFRPLPPPSDRTAMPNSRRVESQAPVRLRLVR